MKGMILAAGLGRRLRPLTLVLAKPAVPFLNRPLIRYALDLMGSLNIEDVMVNIHHLGESVIQALGELRSAVCFSSEKEMQGTAGAIYKVRDFWGNDPFVVCNGKIYFEQDLRPVLEFHVSNNALATLVLVPWHEGDPFRPVFLEEDGKILGFGRDVPDWQKRSGYVFTGVQILSPGLLDFIPDGPSDLVKDVYEPLVQQGKGVMGFVSCACWFECSTPERYLENSMKMLERRGLDCFPEQPGRIDSHHVVLGQRVQIPTGTLLERCVIWDRVQLSAGSHIRDSVIMSGVDLPSGTRLSRAVVTPPLQGSLPPTGEVHGDFWTWKLEGKRSGHV